MTQKASVHKDHDVTSSTLNNTAVARVDHGPYSAHGHLSPILVLNGSCAEELNFREFCIQFPLPASVQEQDGR